MVVDQRYHSILIVVIKIKCKGNINLDVHSSNNESSTSVPANAAGYWRLIHGALLKEGDK